MFRAAESATLGSPRRSGSAGIAVVAMTVGISMTSRARAAEAPVAVAVTECPSSWLSAEAFLSSLRVELAGEARACCTRVPPPRNPSAPAIAPGSTALTVDACAPTTGMAHVQVQDTRTGVALDRLIPLSDVAPAARPRALALAVAELVRDAATPRPPATQPPTTTPTRPHAPPQPTDQRDGWIPVLGVTGRTYVSGNVTLWGFHAALELARGGWQAGLEAHVESARPSVPLGSVDTTFVGGALEVGRRLRSGATNIDLGLIGGLGVVRMKGLTSVPGAVTADGARLEATAGARAAWDFWRIPHQRASLRLMLEGGGVLHGVEAAVNGRAAAGLTGAYLLAGLAATLGPY